MKKRQFLVRAALGLCMVAALTAQSATTISYGCVFCGGGSIVIDDDPVVLDPGPDCVFCGDGSSSSSWNSGNGWSKATSKTAYIVDSDGEYAGIATISTSKKSKGKVSVKIVFKTVTGKKATASKASFIPDDDGTIVAKWSSVKNIGNVEMTLTPDGEVSGTAGAYEFSAGYESDDDDDDGIFTHGEHAFSVDSGDYEMPNEQYDILYETVPMDVAIVTSNKKSWDCGKAPSIKYKKVMEDGEAWYELVGLDDELKTNYSGLKLKYNSKKGTFSGSFKVYATNEGSIEKGKPKLKTYTFSVSGRISGSTGTGIATCKKLKASWEVTID